MAGDEEFRPEEIIKETKGVPAPLLPTDRQEVAQQIGERAGKLAGQGDTTGAGEVLTELNSLSPIEHKTRESLNAGYGKGFRAGQKGQGTQS